MDTLLTDIEQFCAEHGLTEREFGIRALNDHHFIRQLRGQDGEPREPRRKTVERVRTFMRNYEPEPISQPIHEPDAVRIAA